MKQLIQMQSNIRVNIPLNVEIKYNRLCQKFPNLEWSGMVFYKIKNEDLLLRDIEIDLVDLVPLSVDTQTSTGFNFGSSHIEYVVQNKLMGCHFGHIHSHNTMAVFFSGTDNDDLRNSSEHYNFLLSVIVNNKGEVMAKVAQKTTTVSNLNVKTIKGNESTLTNIVADAVTIYDCTIVKEEIPGTFMSWMNKLEVPKVVIPTTGKWDATTFNKGATVKDWFDDYDFKTGSTVKNIVQGELFPKEKSKKLDLKTFISENLFFSYDNSKLTDILKEWEYDEPDFETFWEEYCEITGEVYENVTKRIDFLSKTEETIRKSNHLVSPDVSLLLKKLSNEIKNLKNVRN